MLPLAVTSVGVALLSGAVLAVGCTRNSADASHRPRGDLVTRAGLAPPPTARDQKTATDPSIAQALSAAFRSAADRALHAVVQVTIERSASPQDMAQVPDDLRRFFGWQGQSQGPMPPEVGTGSGVIFDNQGHILTNNHVVANADRVRVRLVDGHEYSAKVVGADPSTDVAVIQIEPGKGGAPLDPITFGDSDSLRAGDWVIALGNPLGLDFTVTAGIVSARGRQLGGDASALQSFIQTDAAINPGNSGGPLVDVSGRMVGMNTAIVGGERFIGYGFAVPVNLARRMMSDILEYGFVRRPRLGISVSNVTAVDAEAYGLDRIAGAEVNRVEEGSPASKAGLQIGDVVVALEGKPIIDANDLTTALAERKPGDKVRLTVIRNRQRREITAELAEFAHQPESRPSAPAGNTPAERLGFEAQAVTPDIARQLGLRAARGVVVTGVVPYGSAASAGIRPGQVLLSINGQAIKSVDDVDAIARRLKPGQVASIRLRDPELGETIVNYRLER
jgi:serine protease Do